MSGFLILSMIFCHIIADYNLQGILAQMKQKEWWEKNYPDFKYKNDYKTALLMHSLSWAFFIEIPLYIYYLSYNPSASLIILNILVIVNTFFHYIIDNKKANKHTLNLESDQQLHIIQIVVTFLIATLTFGG